MKINVKTFFKLSFFGRSQFHDWFIGWLKGDDFSGGKFKKEFDDYQKDSDARMKDMRAALDVLDGALVTAMRERAKKVVELEEITACACKDRDIKKRNAAVKTREVLGKFGYLKDVPTHCREVKCNRLVKRLREKRFGMYVWLLDATGLVDELERINVRLRYLRSAKDSLAWLASHGAFVTACRDLDNLFRPGACRINEFPYMYRSEVFKDAIDKVNEQIGFWKKNEFK